MVNTIYVSEFLKLRFPVIHEILKTNLTAHGLRLGYISGSYNIWVRDYLPIQVGDKFVKFKYKTVGYDEFPWMTVLDKSIDFLKPIYSDIVLDGGNIVKCKDKAIITEKVFVDNPNEMESSIKYKLEKLLECEIIIIPSEPEDLLGHSDGILQWIDEKNVFINDYSVMMQIRKNGWKKYLEDIISRLKDRGIGVELFPYAYNKCPKMKPAEFRAKYPFADDMNQATGYYINYLKIKDLIFLPVFGFPEDRDAVDKLKIFYPKHDIVCIDCNEISAEGGLLHCITMEYKEGKNV